MPSPFVMSLVQPEIVMSKEEGKGFSSDMTLDMSFYDDAICPVNGIGVQTLK
jgi:hypothetical protein